MLDIWAAFCLWRYNRSIIATNVWDRRYKAVRTMIARGLWQR